MERTLRFSNRTEQVPFHDIFLKVKKFREIQDTINFILRLAIERLILAIFSDLFHLFQMCHKGIRKYLDMDGKKGEKNIFPF